MKKLKISLNRLAKMPRHWVGGWIMLAEGLVQVLTLGFVSVWWSSSWYAYRLRADAKRFREHLDRETMERIDRATEGM